MLDKCINQSCSTPFRYLRNGRLFRLESDPLVRASKPKAEYFWLCDRCSAKMNLCITKEGTVSPVMLSRQGSAGLTRKGVTRVDRKDGFLLSTLSFSTPQQCTGAVFFG